MFKASVFKMDVFMFKVDVFKFKVNVSKFKADVFKVGNPHNSVPDNIALLTVLPLQPLFIKFPLVADKTATRALMLLFFVQLFFDIDKNPSFSKR
jgi:hypothetical protein